MTAPETVLKKESFFPTEMLLALVLLAFAVRMFHLDFQSLWRDEVDAIRFSSGSLPVLLRGLVRQGHNGPLFFVALGGWRALTGDSEFALRMFSAAGGTLSVALAWVAGKAIGLKKNTALMAAALIATAPYLVWYSQEAKMYSWLMSAVLVSVILFRRALAQGGAGRWTLFVVVTSLTFYLHILSPLMLAVYALWAVLNWRQAKLHHRGLLGAAAALILPYLPLLAWQFPLLKNGFQSGHPHYPPQTVLNLLLQFYSAGILRTGYAIPLTVATVALAVLGLTAGKLSVRRRLALAGWFALPVAAVLLISLRVAVFEDRYLIYIAPAFFFAVALGVDVLFRRWRWLGAAMLVALLGFNLWGSVRQQSLILKPDFRAAAAFVAQSHTARPASPAQSAPIPADAPYRIFLPLIANNPAPVVLMQMPYLHYTFDYYFDAPFVLKEGLWTNSGRTPEQVDADMRELLSGVKTLFFIVAEEDQWDNRHLVRQWLQSHGTLLDEVHFVGVDVYRYNLGNQPQTK